jgi:hypothetical protein
VTAPLWIKDPLGILDLLGVLAEGAERGAVVDQGCIVECVAAGAEPAAPGLSVFDASRHVVLLGLINTHHHFHQTLTKASPSALDRELFRWLQALYPVWARDAGGPGAVHAGRIALLRRPGLDRRPGAVRRTPSGSRHGRGYWVVRDAVIPGLDMAALVRRHNAAAKALHAE